MTKWLGTLKNIFDRKISDTTLIGFNDAEIKNWLSNVKEINSLKYYNYLPGSKFPKESKILKNQPVREVLSFLNANFAESLNLFVEIQRKVYKSGRQQIIFRGINLDGEITKIGVLNFQIK